jgi:hypothetical protein
MQKTTTKRIKRAYRKKRILTQDELWKLIVPLLWVDFIHSFLPEWVDEIDFSRKPVFLDKDLKRLMPNGKSKNRTVDILMRVYLKNGKHKTFLLHIEVQAYFDKFFPKRVFQYFYRINDYFQEPIETIVLMIDDDPNYRPNEYFEQYGQTSIHFKYRMFKLLDNPPPYPDGNIFSIILEVTWYALEQNMLKNDEDLETLKFRLLKQLVSKKVSEDKIYAVFEFINIYLPFVNPEKDITFVERFDDLINTDVIMEPMTIREFIDKKYTELADKKAKRMAKKMAPEIAAKLAQKMATGMATEMATGMATEMATGMATEMATGMATEMATGIVTEMMTSMAANIEIEAELKAKRQAENLFKEDQKRTIRNLRARGFSVEDIAEVVMKPLDFVLEALEN